MEFIERNADICRRYTNGETLPDIAISLKLSRERVRQLLRKAGIYRRKDPVEKSDRDAFLGVNVSGEDKVALRAEAERRGLSMSALTSDLIKDMLATRQQEAQ